MLVVVESVLLDAAVDAQADGAAQHVEEDQAAEYGPRGIYRGVEQLYAEHVQAAAVEQAAVEGEDARKDRSERAADAVNRYCADGVVDLGHAVEEADGEDHCGAADDACECRAGGADGVTACGDADKDTRHKQEISFLKTVIAKAAAWFPYFREMLRIENLCRLIGFDERQTAMLVKGKPLEYAGELYSEEHGRKFTTEKAGFQVVKDPTDGTRLVLAIDRKPIAEWFKEQFEKVRQNIRRPIQLQKKGRGMKL